MGVGCLISTPTTGSAQSFEVLGTRALGMGGAFVAVADDASAVYWNPAGLATGPLFSLVLDRVESEDTSDNASLGAFKRSGTTFALTEPSFGIAYYRLRSSHLAVAAPGGTAASGGSTGIAPAGTVGLLDTQTAVITAVQTVTSGLTVASSLKLVRGLAVQVPATGDPAGTQLKDVGKLDGSADNIFDLDVGAMLDLGRVRLGLVARNLRTSSFETASGSIVSLDRQIRAGLAVLPDTETAIAVDLDVTEARTAFGVRRVLAFGAERWLWSRRIGVRAGARVNVVGPSDPVASGGVSIGLSRSMWVDGYLSGGGAVDERGWGLSVRLGL